MSWLRWWVGSVNDPKWRLIAAETSCKPGDCVAVWVYLLELGKQHAGGIERLDVSECAIVLGFDTALVTTIIAAMHARGLLIETRIAAWDKRQPKREDGSAERGRIWRESRKELALISSEPSVAFPSSGSISFTRPFNEIARSHGKGFDVDLIATAFRGWCQSRSIPLDKPDIQRVFTTFCKRHRVSHAA